MEMLSWEYWYMFPVAIAIASIAMASGVEGATFFAPIFILGMGLSPEIAIGSGLITEVFGFASGLTAYVRKRLIDYRLGLALIVVTVPMGVLGSWLSGRVDPEALKVILGMGLIAIALSFLKSPSDDAPREDAAIAAETERPETCVTPAEGEPICYTVCNRTEGGVIAGIGALFMGMISTGLGELNGWFLLRRCRVPSKVAVATSVFVVAITALSAAIGHAVRFVQEGGDAIETVVQVCTFTVPGVIIGGQFGAAVASRIPQHTLEKTLGVLFALIGGFMLAETVF